MRIGTGPYTIVYSIDLASQCCDLTTYYLKIVLEVAQGPLKKIGRTLPIIVVLLQLKVGIERYKQFRKNPQDTRPIEVVGYHLSIKFILRTI